MKINRVVLKNYRIHEYCDISFDKGINLLLGKNGAGKSSVLEAVGLALFDAHVRSTITEAVRHSSKSAVIIVEIEGNDGNEYIVERRIGSGALVKLFIKGDKGPRLEGKELVFKKIRELAGIESNEKTIYEQVITASQNKIVDLFVDTEVNREKIFNHIFDTAIYRRMYEQYAKDACDRYMITITVKTQQLQGLRTSMVDDTELLCTLGKEKEIRKQIHHEYVSVEKMYAALECEQEQLNEVKRAYDKLTSDIGHVNEMIDLRTDEREKIQHAIGESEYALKIVCENEPYFLQYEQISTQLHDTMHLIEALEQFEQEKEQITISMHACDLYERETVARLQFIEKENNRLDKELHTLQNDIDTLNRERISYGEELQQVESRRILYAQLYADFQDHMERLDSEQKKIKDITCAIALHKEKILNDNVCDTTIKKLQAKRRHYYTEREKQRELEYTRQECDIKLKEITAAYERMKHGCCPFFRERCINIQNGSLYQDCFQHREKEIAEQKAHYTAQLLQYTDSEQHILAIEKELAVFYQKSEDNETCIRTIESLENEEKAIQEVICSIQSEIRSLLAPMKLLVTQQWSDDTAQSVLTQVKDVLDTQCHKQVLLEKSIEEKQQALGSLASTYRETFDAKMKNIEEYEQLQQELKQKKAQQQTMQEKKQQLESHLVQLSVLKEKRRELDQALAEIKTPYDLYIRYKQKADESDRHKESCIRIKNELQKIISEKDQLVTQKTEYEKRFSEKQLADIHQCIKQQKIRAEELQQQLSQSAVALALAEKALTENRQRQEDAAAMEKEIALLQKKLELAREFRNKMASMGKYVAARLLKRIQTIATRNFRSITGRTEEIQWINNEKESYAVYVCGRGNQQKKFVMLSGGEQVAVALAIRAAMVSVLTRAHIALFDEPTINLDAEKKAALADSLKEMLKDLTQAIIVTHDDTFREMAQRIINLG